jgi:hypothetical protein
VITALTVTKRLAPTWSLAAQMIAKTISTTNHSAHSAFPGTVSRAPAGQFICGIVYPGGGAPGGGGGGVCSVVGCSDAGGGGM